MTLALEERKRNAIQVRVNDETLRDLQRAAKANKMSPTAYARELLVKSLAKKRNK